MTKGVFSEYELRKMAIKFAGESAYAAASCVGSFEEELNSRVITKRCRGVVAKTTVTGAGDGTLRISMHVPYEIYNTAYGMKIGTLTTGVVGYGTKSRHKAFSLVMHVFDEDGEEKYKAYPNCIIQSALSRSTENGAEEVAELELEISVMPDDDGFCMYEALAKNITTEIKNSWMTNFYPGLVNPEIHEMVTVTYHLTGVKAPTSAPETVAKGEMLDINAFSALTGYNLPSTVTVKVGEAILDPVSGQTGDYVYGNGRLNINGTAITDNVEITVTGTVTA